MAKDTSSEQARQAYDAARNGRAERTTFTARELQQMQLPAVRWAIPDILPEGITLLAGRSKIGKSFLVFGWCVAVASGGNVLGRVPVGRGDVHYFALDDNKRRLQKRLAGIVGDRPAPDNLTISVECPRLDEGGVEVIRDWLKDHPAARLVAIDILKNIRPSSAAAGQGGRWYDADYDALAELKPLVDEFGVAIVVVHHLNQGQSENPHDLIGGTEGLIGGVDGTLVLKRDRGKQDATLHVAGNDIAEDREYALRWDAATASWSLLGDAEDFRMSDQRIAIRDALARMHRAPGGAFDGATAAEIANAIDQDYDNARHLIRKMADEGIVAVSRTEGTTKYYVLPNPPNNNNNNDNNDNDDNGGNNGVVIGGSGTDNNTFPDSYAENEGVVSDVAVVRGGAGGTSDEFGEACAALMADLGSVPWLEKRLERYAADPDRWIEDEQKAATWIAAHLGEPVRWPEAAPPLRKYREGEAGRK